MNFRVKLNLVLFALDIAAYLITGQAFFFLLAVLCGIGATIAYEGEK